jgi:hypothetical protein
VYYSTEKHARELGIKGVCASWGGCSGTHVSISSTTTDEQLAQLRARVQADMDALVRARKRQAAILSGGQDIIPENVEYTFSVDDVSKIDFARIIKENDNAQAILLVGGNACLLLHEKFLSLFEYEDRVFVAVKSSPIRPGWGYQTLSAALNEREVLFGHNGLTAAPYRCFAFPKGSIEAVLKELQEARQYKRRVTVTVKRV